MKAFGLRWWLAAGGLTLLLATLELSAIAVNTQVTAPRAGQGSGAVTAPAAEEELLGAPEIE